MTNTTAIEKRLLIVRVAARGFTRLSGLLAFIEDGNFNTIPSGELKDEILAIYKTKQKVTVHTFKGKKEGWT